MHSIQWCLWLFGENSTITTHLTADAVMGESWGSHEFHSRKDSCCPNSWAPVQSFDVYILDVCCLKSWYLFPTHLSADCVQARSLYGIRSLRCLAYAAKHRWNLPGGGGVNSLPSRRLKPRLWNAKLRPHRRCRGVFCVHALTGRYRKQLQ